MDPQPANLYLATSESALRGVGEEARREPPQFPFSRVAIVLVSLILFAAALVYLHRLGERSLWLDEATSVSLANQGWKDFFIEAWTTQGNMILYHLLLRGWVHLGDNEFALRSLSVLFGLLNIAVIYVLGRRFFSEKTGLASAALLAVHSFHIRYAQEARGYTILLFLLMLSTYFFLRLSESPGVKKYRSAYVLISALAIYTHVFAGLVLAAQWFSLGWARARKIGLKEMVGRIAVFTAPMTIYVLAHGTKPIDWIPRPSAAFVLLTIHRLVGGFVSRFPTPAAGKALLGVYAACWVLALAGVLDLRRVKPPRQRDGLPVKLVALWLTFPFVFTLIASLIKPLFLDRYLIICVPAAVLLAAQGMTTLDRVPRLRTWLFAGVLTVAIGLSLWGTRQYFASLGLIGSDWRSATRYILARQHSGDAAIFFRAGTQPFLYYVQQERERHGVKSFPTLLFPTDEKMGNQRWIFKTSRRKFEEATRGYRRVWLVLYGEKNTRGEPISSLMPEDVQLLEERQKKGQGEPSSFLMPEDFRLLEAQEFWGLWDSPITVNLYARAP